MSITIGSNISSLKAQRELAKGTDALSKTIERMSSGLRINRASDDPAGLSIALNLKTDARIYQQAIRNVNDGVSMLDISEGALTELSNITFRQRELAEQAANGVYSTSQRKAMQQESNALTKEFARIVQSTKFNGIGLLDTPNLTTIIQAGKTSADGIAVVLGLNISTITGDGTFGASTGYSTVGLSDSVSSGDLNGDGVLDLVTVDRAANVASVLIGNGNGTFRAPVSIVAGDDTRGAILADFNGDGILDIGATSVNDNRLSIMLGNGDGTFRPRITFATGLMSSLWITSADFNGDGRVDVVIGDHNAGSTSVSVLLGNGNGTFGSAATYLAGTMAFAPVVGDLNGDGKDDIVVNDYGGAAISVLINNGNGTFKARVSYQSPSGTSTPVLGDFNGDDILDVYSTAHASANATVRLGNGDGTFKGPTTYLQGSTTVNHAFTTDLNGDGLLDIASGDNSGTLNISLGNGDGSFKAPSSFSVGAYSEYLTTGDFNGDGALDIASANYTSTGVRIFMGNPVLTTVTTPSKLNLMTQSGARAALTSTNIVLKAVALQRGTVGAYQSRLGAAAENLKSVALNFEEAASRIYDADVAQEAAELVRRGILQQATAAVLAQANQQPAIALKLLTQK